MPDLIEVKPKIEDLDFDPKRLIPVKRNEDKSFVTGPVTDTPFDASRLIPIDSIEHKQPIGEDIPPLTDYLKFKYQRGFLPLVRGSFGREAMWGRMDSQEALDKGNDAYLEQLEKAGKLREVTFKEAPMKAMLGEAAEMLPFMLSSVQEGLKNGLALGGGWATITAAAGQLGLQAAFPEEVITVPTAFAFGMSTGMVFGVITNSMNVEGGNTYLDLIKEGISEKTARPLSLGAGLASGVIEALELALFAAPFKRVFGSMIRDKVSKGALRRVIEKYVKTLGVQIGQEELQEVVTIATEMIAGSIENNPNVVPTAEQIRERLIQVAVKSAQGLAILGVPGAAVTGLDTTAIVKEAAKGEVDEKKGEKEFFVEEKVVGYDFDIKKDIIEEKIGKEVPTKEVEAAKKKQISKKKQQKETLNKLEAGSKPLVKEEEVKTPGIEGKLSKADKFQNTLARGFYNAKKRFIALNPMDVVFDLMDKGESFKGINFMTFKRPIDLAFKKRGAQVLKVKTPVLKFHNEAGLDEVSYRRILVMAILQQDKSVEGTPGRQKLLRSFSEKELNTLEEKGLTEDETKMLKLMQRGFEKLKPQLKKVMKDVYGKDFKEVEDFFPMLTDFDAMEGAEIQNMFGDDAKLLLDLVVPERKPQAKEVSTKFLKERVGGAVPIKTNALNVFLKHVDNATYLINMAEDIVNLLEIAKTDQYRASVGTLGQETAVNWLKLMARRGGAEGGRIGFLDWMRNNVGVAVLGYKLSTILIQPTALLDGAAIIGGYAFKGAVNTWGFSAKQTAWRKFIKDNSVEMQLRVADDPAFAAFMDNILDDSLVAKLKKHAFTGVRFLDSLTASAIMAGAYEKIVTEKGGKVDFANPDKDAITEAELIVRRSQASGHFKDLPAVSSQGAFTGNVSIDKLIFQFQTFMLGRASLVTQTIAKPSKASTLIFTYLTAALIAEVLVRRGVEEIFSQLTGDEPDEPLKDVFFEKLALEAVGAIPIVAQGVNAIRYKQIPIPVISLAQQGVARAGLTVVTKDDKKKIIQAARAITELAGVIGGVPGASQIDQIIGKIFKNKKKKDRSISRF